MKSEKLHVLGKLVAIVKYDITVLVDLQPGRLGHGLGTTEPAPNNELGFGTTDPDCKTTDSNGLLCYRCGMDSCSQLFLH